MRIRWRVAFSSTRLYWICQLGGWGTFYVMQFLLLLTLRAGPPSQLAIGRVIEGSSFLIATHLFRVWIKRHAWLSLPASALIPRLAVSIPLAAVFVMSIVYSAAFLLKPGPQTSAFLLRPISKHLSIAIGSINCIIVICLWTACYFGAIFVRQSKLAEMKQLQLSQALQFAELRLLKSQLNPHFLFNSLNSVRALIAENPERAQTAVTQLARTLRYTLSSSRDEVVTLEHELEIVRDYLEIEALRLAERLRLVWNIAPNSYSARIPIMLLQTLVENAVKHGISQLPGGGQLRVSARVENEILLIEVANERPSVNRSPAAASSGTGLVNASQRLQLMFGPPADLQLDLHDPASALAVVRVPQKRLAQQSHGSQV